MAVESRTANFHDLVYGRNGNSFNLAIEALIPVNRRNEMPGSTGYGAPDIISYEILIELDVATERLHIGRETVSVSYSQRLEDQYRPVTPHRQVNRSIVHG